jgi:hypothetical protein
MGCSVKGLLWVGPVNRKFGENLILSLRKPICKQAGDFKCFCAIGLGPVGQGWQMLRPGQQEIAKNP